MKNKAIIDVLHLSDISMCFLIVAMHMYCTYFLFSGSDGLGYGNLGLCD